MPIFTKKLITKDQFYYSANSATTMANRTFE